MKRPPRQNAGVPQASVPGGPTGVPAEWPLWALLVLFIASGCSALIYEILWFQMLELVVGSSALSLGILLGTYMGGMCLGSLLLPRFVLRREHPIRVYALLELGIAALGIVVYFAVPLVGQLSAGGGGQGLWGILLRATIACLCLLPPTMLMGATLPAISRWVETTPRGVSWLGVLYSSNIAGAIVGCLLAGFHLLRLYDLVVALLVAVALNLFAGVFALLLARRTSYADAAHEPARPSMPVRPGAVHLATAISGLCALGGQVVWTRILALLLGATVYTFSIILGVFLFGLGVGSSFGAMLARSSTQPRRELGLCQLLLAVAIAWSAYMVSRSLPYWPINFSLSKDPWITFQMDLARCVWALFPPSVLWGASFPLALAAASKPGADPARVVASVYAANTIGAIAGALAFTFLIPVIGTQVEQQVMVGLSAAVGVLLLAPLAVRPGERVRSLLKAGAIALGILAAGLAVWSVPPVPSALVALGRFVVFRLTAPGLPSDVRKDPNILFMGEGLTESVAVSEKSGVRIFHVSGKIEASTSYVDMRLQRMLGHLPALANPEPHSVLIVGCGAGVTAGSFTLYPSIKRIVICEIEPLVPRKVTPYFRNENYDVLSDPRVEVVYDDARHYVLTTREKFDIVTSDPIHPWVRGSGSLYSREYFRLVKRLLNPGGVVSQWVPVYQASEDAVKSELATFFSVFPNSTVWAGINAGTGFDLVMLGTDGPTTIDLARLQARAAQPEFRPVAESLLGVGFRSTFELMATYLGRPADLTAWTAGAVINRDGRPWLQYRAGWDSYSEQRHDLFDVIARYRRFPVGLFTGPEALQQAVREAGSVVPGGASDSTAAGRSQRSGTANGSASDKGTP
jgi:spermidine synthase